MSWESTERAELNKSFLFNKSIEKQNVAKAFGSSSMSWKARDFNY